MKNIQGYDMRILKCLLLMSLVMLAACGSKSEEEPPSVTELQEQLAGSTEGLNNAKKFVKTCRCQGCKMVGVDLSGFKPAEEKRFAPRTIGNHYVTTVCDLSHANLNKANLSGVNFSAKASNYCTVPEELGCDSFVVATKMVNTKLKGANLSNAFLVNITFNLADLSGADLSNSEVTLSHFAGAKLIGANMENIVAYQDKVLGLQADMRNTDFSKANLKNANITAIFTGSSFRGANCENAYLNTDESISGGLLPWQRVNFIHTNLKGAMIGINKKDGKHVPGISDIVIKNAILCRTIMPDGREENRDCRKSKVDGQRVG